MPNKQFLVHISEKLTEAHRVGLNQKIEELTVDPAHAFYGYSYQFEYDLVGADTDRLVISSDRSDLENMALATQLSMAILHIDDSINI